MQVPSPRFVVFVVARSRAALWTPFFRYFGTILAPFCGPRIDCLWVNFWTPEKVGSKSEKDATAQIRRSRGAAGECWGAAPGRGKGRGKPLP